MVIDTGMTLYEMNQQLMDSYEPLDPIVLNTKLMEVATVLTKSATELDTKYYMLLNGIERDYTLFVIYPEPQTEDTQKLATELAETLTNRGQILDISPNKELPNSYEIWIKMEDGNRMYMLFDYSDAVIEI